MRLLLATLVLGFGVSFHASADSSTGCGLGSMIWKQNSIVSALFRATTNHSFSSQLFGITTGTSGCSQHSIVKRDMYPIYYAEANLPELRHEMALGQGEYLATFAQVMGCDAKAQGEFIAWAKDSYGTLFVNENTDSKLLLKNLSQFKHTTTAKSCDNLTMI